MKRLLLILLLWPSLILAADYAPRHVLVRPQKGIVAADVAAQAVHHFSTGWELWTLAEGHSVEQMVAELNSIGVEAEPDYYQYADDVPNDQYLGNQWAWAKIGAFAAWDQSKGNGVLVGIVDTGITYMHPDLIGNIFTDTDGSHGYDFYDDDNDPADENGHGTHTAGTVAAVTGNVFGVAGTAPRARLMALRFLGPCGAGITSDAIRAIDYGVAHGVKVFNNSWGGGAFSQALQDSVTAAAVNSVFVVSGGNSGMQLNLPCTSTLACYAHVLAVAASDQNDLRASFSNYGTAIPLAAPGVLIYSTFDCVGKLCGNPPTGFAYLSGTSMASPHVAGAAALVWFLHPEWTADQIHDSLIATGDPLPWIGSRLNLSRAVGIASPTPTPTPTPAPAHPCVGKSKKWCTG